MNPLVSVIIPARNSAETLVRSVDSVVKQDYREIEVIIIVNGSVDSTLEIAKSIKDSRVKVVESQPGIVPALNVGIKISQGKYIARQDADDEWLPHKLKKQIEVLETGEVDVLGTQMIVSESSGTSSTSYPLTHEECCSWLFNSRNPIGHPSVVFRSSLIEKSGSYWEFYPFAEDMDLWMRMLPHARLGNLQESLITYHHVHNPKYDSRVPRAVAHHYARVYGITC